MKLRIVRKDKDGVETPLDEFAKIIDKKTRAMEVIAADMMQIDEIVYLRKRGIIQMKVVLGGRDSLGVFHQHPEMEMAQVSLHKERPNDLAIWERNKLDEVFDELWKVFKPFLLNEKFAQVIAASRWNAADAVIAIANE